MIATLGLSVAQFSRHRRREVIEAYLRLVHRDDEILTQILQNPRHAAFVTLVNLLSKSPHGSIIALVTSFLDDPQVPSAVLSVTAKRTDLQFVRGLLRKVGDWPTATVAQNLKRIDSIAWTRCVEEVINQLDEAEQEAAVRVVMASATPRAQAWPLVEHLLFHGKPAGARAAAEALERFQGAEANRIVLGALDYHGDPEVQARVLSQLRSRGIPGALTRLLRFVESPHPKVRLAAQNSLAEFTFQRFLGSFDLLDDEARQNHGEIVKKVDPQTVPELRAEIASQVRTRCLRGLAIARLLDLAPQVEDAVLDLLRHTDPIVRAEAVATLFGSRSQRGQEALVRALDDPSPTVRAAACESFQSPNLVRPPPLLIANEPEIAR